MNVRSRCIPLGMGFKGLSLPALRILTQTPRPALLQYAYLLHPALVLPLIKMEAQVVTPRQTWGSTSPSSVPLLDMVTLSPFSLSACFCTSLSHLVSSVGGSQLLCSLVSSSAASDPHGEI